MSLGIIWIACLVVILSVAVSPAFSATPASADKLSEAISQAIG